MIQSYEFPHPRLKRAFLWYRIVWVLGLPIVLAYLFWRALKDPRYLHKWPQRFGFAPGDMTNAVWIHAVSLGEVRSAVPLARHFLNNGDNLIFTVGTPAGRHAVQTEFFKDIGKTVQLTWVPIETAGAFRRFFKRTQPKFGLVMEVEFWPEMIRSCRDNGVKLFLCNGQYPGRSFKRDMKKRALRSLLPSGFAGVMVKSQMMAQRFEQVRCKNIAITGELRFAQPIPQHQVCQAVKVKKAIARPVITLASIVAGEENIYANAIQTALARPNPPMFIYVPRAPERFDPVAHALCELGINVTQRTQAFDDQLAAKSEISADVIVGDSLGEMYFYLGLADYVTVGGGFTPAASHNIIEPLAMSKTVAVGPNTSTIEYPFKEAFAAGLVDQFQSQDDIDSAFAKVTVNPPQRDGLECFLTNHRGAVDKTIASLDTWGVTTR